MQGLDLFTDIIKISSTGGPILVLDLTTGRGPPASTVPPMTITGIPGNPGTFNVFNDNMTLIKPKGKATPIVDPISPAMRANLLTWPKNKVLTSASGTIFLFCNVSLMRGQLAKGEPLQLILTTPGAGAAIPHLVNFYWIAFNGSGFFPDPSNPFHNPPFDGGNSVGMIYRDAIKGDQIAGGGIVGADQPGSGNVCLFSGGGFPNFVIGQVLPTANNVFNTLTQLNTPPSNVVPPGVFLSTAQVNVGQTDTTQWGITAAIWKKNNTFAGLLPVSPQTTFPVPGSEPQPDSKASKGAFSQPSQTVTVTVSAAPNNTVTLA